MVLHVRMERVLTPSGVNLTCVPVMVTTAQRYLVMVVLCNDIYLFL